MTNMADETEREPLVYLTHKECQDLNRLIKQTKRDIENGVIGACRELERCESLLADHKRRIQNRLSWRKRNKHKAFAQEHGLSEYKVAKYGIGFLTEHPDVLESLKLIHAMTGYKNVDPEVKQVRKEIARDNSTSNYFPDKRNEYSKNYYENNKTNIIEKQRQKRESLKNK